jgi:chloride channel protein, CIC family
MLRRGAHNERARVPPPVVPRRLPSGRGAIEQPNAGHDGAAALTPMFWLAVIVTGVATGLFGDVLMALLFHVERLAFGYHSGSLLDGVRAASNLRRVVVLLIGGAFGAVAWYLLRRFARGPTEVDDALWRGTGELSFWRSLGTSAISEVVIGFGASIGREAAPKLMGGASGSVIARWARLSPQQRRLLVSCGAGAGLAAVYNVPIGGALFTAEVLVGSISLPVILPALACSAIATQTARWYLPGHPSYIGIPHYHSNASLIVWAFLLGPLTGVLAAGYIRLIGWISYHRAKGAALLIAMPAALGVLGLLGIAYPELFGNGKGIVGETFVGEGGLTLLLALFLLKPLVTALCLGAGASGGLFTPVLSTGALFGGFLGLAWTHLWHGTPLGAFAMVGGAAMIGAAMQAPLAALVLVIELTDSGLGLSIPIIAATVIATVIARYLDGYSIYSARLPAISH